MIQVQTLEISTTYTCKVHSKSAVQTATSDEVKLFTYAGAQKLEAADARGKMHRHQAQTKDNPAQLGEAFVVAINVSPKQNDYSQPGYARDLFDSLLEYAL